MCNCKLVRDLGNFIKRWNDEISEDADIGKIHLYDLMEDLEHFYDTQSTAVKKSRATTPTKPVVEKPEGCNKCEDYIYTIEGSYCTHPTTVRNNNGEDGLFSKGFIDGKYPDWCPIKF